MVLEIVVDRAAIAQGLGVVRVDRKRLRELRQRFVRAAQRLERKAMVVQRDMGVRIELDRGPQKPLGFVILSGADKNGAEHAQCQRMI